MVKSNIEGYPEHIHSKEKIQGKMTEKIQFDIGVIGLGRIGSALVHYALAEFAEYPNVNINIYSRSFNDQEKSVKDHRLREIIGDLPISPDRVRSFKSIDGELSVNGSKKRLLDSDIIVYCARNQTVPFSDFKEREDEFFANLPKLREDAERLRDYQHILLNATNPLELTSEAIARISRIPRNRIIAGSYIDTSRYRLVISEQLFKLKKISIPTDLLADAVVIGEHGPGMVPVYSLIEYEGKKLFSSSKIDKDNRKRIREAVKDAVIVGPTKFQTEEISLRNVRVPSRALIKTILAIQYGQTIPTTSYSSDSQLTNIEDCFITGMCSFKSENKKERVAIVNPEFLTEIWDSERRQYERSKRNLVQRINSSLKKAGLN